MSVADSSATQHGMSGERGAKTDKAAEIWFRLILNDGFKNELEQLRTLVRKGETEEFVEYFFQQDQMLREHGVIPTARLRELFDGYVLGKKHKTAGPHIPVRLQTPSDEELADSKRGFMKLWIYDDASRDEILEYIKKNWVLIKKIIGEQNAPRVRRVRKIENKEQIELILDYNKMTTEELKRYVGAEEEPSAYREILIRRALLTDGHTPVSEEAIKSVVTRYAKKSTDRLTRPD